MSTTLLTTIIGPLYNTTPDFDDDVPVVYRTLPVSPMTMNGSPVEPSEVVTPPITEEPQ